MKFVILAALAALSIPVDAQKPPRRLVTFPERAKQLDLFMLELQVKGTNDLPGRWMAVDGDYFEFTKDGKFSITTNPVKPDIAKLGKGISGTYAVTADRRLNLTCPGLPVITVDYRMGGDALTIKAGSGKVTVHHRMTPGRQAFLTVNELLQLENAMDQWSIIKSKRDGDRPTPADLQAYLKPGSRLYYALGDPTGPKDPLGNPYWPLVVGVTPKIPAATLATLSTEDAIKYWHEKIEDE